jgi:hypothetical protein
MNWIHDDGAILAVLIAFLVAWVGRGWLNGRGL